MDIKSIVKKHLLEAKMSRETEAYLSNKWPGVPLETIKTIYDWFESVKNSFPTDPTKVTGRILSFLGWFNGSSPSRPKFEIKNIRDIRSYSLPQIKRLWSEYRTDPLFTDEEGEDKPRLSVDKIFYEKVDGRVPDSSQIIRYVENPESEDIDPETKELFNKSKELWFGTQHLVFEDNGFRVYNIPDQATSIAFGWYLNFIRRKFGYGGGQWCTTTPNKNNYFQSKRQDRSFYFVIDESKFPTENANSFYDMNEAARHMPNFYLAALQIMSNGREFRMSGIHNPGEPTYSQQKLLEIYPKLAPVLASEKIKYTPWNRNDQIDSNGKVDPISMINEIEGHEYEFYVRPPAEKMEYVSRAASVLRKAKSWLSMNEAMKQQYSFGSLTVNNMFDRFSTSELFKALTQGERKTLNTKIEILQPGRGGIKLIINNIMQNDFYVDERLSLDKEYLSLYRSRSTGKFGIYNLKEDNWVNFDGITFDDEYQQVSERAYKTNDGKRFFVVIYSRSGQPDDKSFYVLLPISGNKIDGYFVSAKKWEELKVQLVGETDPEKTNTDFDPEQDNDIKEMKKGV
jgi:hypothetical protein